MRYNYVHRQSWLGNKNNGVALPLQGFFLGIRLPFTSRHEVGNNLNKDHLFIGRKVTPNV